MTLASLVWAITVPCRARLTGKDCSASVTSVAITDLSAEVDSLMAAIDPSGTVVAVAVNTVPTRSGTRRRGGSGRAGMVVAFAWIARAALSARCPAPPCGNGIVTGARSNDPASTLIMYCPDSDTKFGVAISTAVSIGLPPRAPSSSDDKSSLHVTAMSWLPGGTALAVIVGDSSLAVVTRWGSVVQLTPAPPLLRLLELNTKSAAVVPVHLSLAAPLQRLRDVKAGSGPVSIVAHAAGSRVMFCDGAVAVELLLPTYVAMGGPHEGVEVYARPRLMACRVGRGPALAQNVGRGKSSSRTP